MSKTSAVTLESYIQEVCEQIVRGVLNAQKNEEVGSYIGVGEKTSFVDESHSYVTNVKFDVAAEINTSLSGSGKVGVTVIGGKGEVSKAESSANRISFEVPVAIPLPNELKAKHKAIRDRNTRDLEF